jgi:hypothetical protein
MERGGAVLQSLIQRGKNFLNLRLGGDFPGIHLILYHCGFKITTLLHENHLPGF